jgi:hypothetical protein
MHAQERALAELNENATDVCEQLKAICKERKDEEASGDKHAVAAESLKREATRRQQQARARSVRGVPYAVICLASAATTLYSGFIGWRWFWIPLGVTIAALAIVTRQIRYARRLMTEARSRHRGAEQASGRAQRAVQKASGLKRKSEQLSCLAARHARSQSAMTGKLEELRDQQRELTDLISSAEAEIEGLDLLAIRQERKRIEALLAKAPPS